MSGINLLQPDNPPERQRESWHLDKRVPISLIAAILIQTGGIIWWGATMNEKVTILQERMNSLTPYGERLATLEANILAIKDTLLDIKLSLRQQNQNQNRQ